MLKKRERRERREGGEGEREERGAEKKMWDGGKERKGRGEKKNTILWFSFWVRKESPAMVKS